jgi:predicted nucleotidyltransferase
MHSRKPQKSLVIQAMISRIVKRFQPERIILFGSQARGTASADSDVDLLVVMNVSGSKRQKQLEIRLALQDFPVSKDIVVATPEEFEGRKEILGTIERPAALEGKVLYTRRVRREIRHLLPREVRRQRKS